MEFDEVTQHLNNKIDLLQNEMTITNDKLEAGFGSNNALLSHVITEIKTIATVITASSPTSSPCQKKTAFNPDKTQDTLLDNMSGIENDK